MFYTFWNNATATTSTDIPWAKWDAPGGVPTLESHIIAVQQSQSVTALAVRLDLPLKGSLLMFIVVYWWHYEYITQGMMHDNNNLWQTNIDVEQILATLA